MSADLQAELLEAVREQYPDAENLLTMCQSGVTGLKTQQVLYFSEP